MSAQQSTRREFLRMMGIGTGVLGTARGIADCRLPIADWRFAPQQSVNPQSPISNLQSKSPQSPISNRKVSNRTIDEGFFVRPEELTLRFSHGRPERRLSFDNFEGSPEAWKKACRDKLAELLGLPRQESRNDSPGGSVKHSLAMGSSRNRRKYGTTGSRAYGR